VKGERRADLCEVLPYLAGWLFLKEVGRVDSAACNHSDRRAFLEAIRHTDAAALASNGDSLLKIDLAYSSGASLVKWMNVRGISASRLCISGHTRCLGSSEQQAVIDNLVLLIQRSSARLVELRTADLRFDKAVAASAEARLGAVIRDHCKGLRCVGVAGDCAYAKTIVRESRNLAKLTLLTGANHEPVRTAAILDSCCPLLEELDMIVGGGIRELG
jgi:hypothetical protein